MPSSTNKKAILYRFDRQPAEGLVNPANYLQGQGLEFLTLDGNLQAPAYEDCKALCFVSESTGRPDLFLEHTLFERRPKLAGLWARFYLKDGDRLDGVLSHNLLDWPSAGYLLVPPHAGAHRQRVFVPRAALIATELRGVVGKSASSARSKRQTAPLPEHQLTMFES